MKNTDALGKFATIQPPPIAVLWANGGLHWAFNIRLSNTGPARSRQGSTSDYR
jgi:hypothetical protein